VRVCYGYLRGVVMVFKGCCYAMDIYGVWSSYGYLGGVVMLWVFEGCGYVMGI
jgi:hypothetical protein